MLRLVVSKLSRPTFNPAGGALLVYRKRSSVADIQEDTLEDAKPYAALPGPKPLPLLGNTWRFLPVIGEFSGMCMDDLVNTFRKKYGDIAKLTNISDNPDMVYLFNSKDVEKLFRNEGQWPNRPVIKTVPYYRSVLRKDLYKGIEGLLTTKGKQWQEFRTRVNQTMMQPRNAKLYVGPISEVADDLIARMRSLKNAAGELPSNFIEDLNRWSLESIALIALDTRLGCLKPDLKPDSEPQKMIKAVNYMFQALFELDVKPSFVHFTKRKEWKKLVETLDLFNEVAMKYVDQAMDEIKNKIKSGEGDMSVLESLLIKNEDPLYAMVMALDMLMAGIDTTSHASAMALHFLARNPGAQEKLFKELQTILPLKGERITARHLEDMKYLRACIKEVMRISPIGLGTAREVQKDIVLGNYIVPKGVTVIAAVKTMCMDENNFPRPDCFIPERWLKDSEDYHKINPFVFLPFGFGPRMCVGRRFAELEIETLLAKVFRNFRLEYDQELVIKSHAIRTVVSPLNFKLEDRP